MDAPGAVRRVAWPRAGPSVVVHLARATIVTLFATLALGVVLVFARRVSGALVAPLPIAALVLIALALGVAALVFRSVLGPTANTAHPGWRYTLSSAPSLILLMAAIGLLAPGTPTAGFVVVLGVLLLEEGWSWGRLFPAIAVGPTTSDTPLSRHALDQETIDAARAGTDFPAEPPESDDEHTVQWMRRRREDDGRQSIEGFTRVDFEAGQRHAVAHVAICPPLPRVPVCYAEPCSGPDAEANVAQVLPHGVRIEVKLDRLAGQPEQVIVEFSIQESADGD